MSKLCKLCGADTTAPDFKSPLKQMCLNCKDFSEDENGACACCNEKVLEKGKKKIMENVPEGYEVDTITLKRLVLKDPTKKCGEYEADIDAVMMAVGSVYGFAPVAAGMRAAEIAKK